MNENITSSQAFGGDWTSEKLNILSAYLTAYTTALKKQSFHLTYVDAFAGTGSIRIELDDDRTAFLQGSVQRALGVTDKPFDSLLFIEEDTEKAALLRAETSKHMDRVAIAVGDANSELPKYCHQMNPKERAVVFLDPFALEVDWQTIETLAETGKCDVWILFPISTIRRMLPRHRMPAAVSQNQLTRVFGDESWRGLYDRPDQTLLPFLEDDRMESVSGIDPIVQLYRVRLNSVFAKVAPTSRTLRNSKNAPLYEFMFAASNPRGADLAVKIANDILKKI